MNKFLKTILVAFLIVFLPLAVFGQYVPGTERGDSGKRGNAQMEGNNIRTSIFNFGWTGRTDGTLPLDVQTPYEWPKNTGQVYLALTAIFVAGEVTDDNGQIIKIVDLPNGRNAPDGSSWNFEPVPGYYNESRTERSIATSVDETTWPAFWPDKENDEIDPGWAGSWNGLGGKDDFRADQEIFYRSSDDKYDRYTTYFPDTTDYTRKGLGILLDVRTLAWSQILVQDAIYILHNVKNDGTKDIPKGAITAWHADFVGGNGDSQDDFSEFDLLLDVAFSYDKDNRAPDFGSDPVGIVAQAFLETPGNSDDRVDNDGDGEVNGPKVSEELLVGENVDNLLDDNENGLIDENETHIPFGVQVGVTFADRIDQNNNGEDGSPIITQEMIDLASTDQWKRWPNSPFFDAIQDGQVHLLMVDADDLGMKFSDFIDNNNNAEEGSPTITQEMINQASTDTYFRYKLDNGLILYNVIQSTLGLAYADGIDNNNNGAIDENIDEQIDEMVDESRENGIDEDGDWNVLTDDVGVDGVAGTGDYGENDGVPTSGARFNLPGEPNVDVTDVSETDQIGITNAQYEPAGAYNFSTISDAELWFKFMRPGLFYNPQEVVAGEYDLFISSSYFPIKSGQTEPISVSVILANGPVSDPDAALRKAEIQRKKLRVQETYENDYQFANAPFAPNVTAIPGDNRVTLHWDDIAESSFDDYIDKIGGDGNDFEGYKIYRAQDPAFLDPYVITNGYGNLVFRTPIAQFDLVDAYSGFDSVGIDGVHYYLGDNTGLKHSFVDSTVKNGFTYYYAVVAYDFGYPTGNIIPSESPIRISLQSDGTVRTGPNVVKIVPSVPAAGYVPPTLGVLEHTTGTSTGQITSVIIDINQILDGNVYEISFEDTLKMASSTTVPDTLTTKNFTLVNTTSGDTLINHSSDILSDEQPLTEGFRLSFTNEDRVEINTSESGWSSDSIQTYIFEKFKSSVVADPKGSERPNDYIISFYDESGADTSTAYRLFNTNWPSQPVNFKVYNISEKRYVDFVFIDLDTNGGPGTFSALRTKKDRIIFLEPNSINELIITWTNYLSGDTTGAKQIPQEGDSLIVKLKKPFLSSDKFTFVASAGTIDEAKAKDALDDIKVVPNPYVAQASWEVKNPFNSGRGPRLLQFIHLPAQCTIKIFTVSGELVKEIEHNTAFADGTEYWDMLTKDNLGIAYGVYVFYVDAPGIGTKIGKFAVIK